MSARHSIAIELSELGKLARQLLKAPVGAGESSAARALVVRSIEEIDGQLASFQERITALESGQNAALDERFLALRVSFEREIRSLKRNT